MSGGREYLVLREQFGVRRESAQYCYISSCHGRVSVCRVDRGGVNRESSVLAWRCVCVFVRRDVIFVFVAGQGTPT